MTALPNGSKPDATHQGTAIDPGCQPVNRTNRFWLLALGSVGVVYGDIGTSPLYALREALRHTAENGVTPVEVLGIVSLLIWSLILLVTVKYVIFLLRADNNGEGGTLSLLAQAEGAIGKRSVAIFSLAMVGAALFYGDAIITPAISVLSAVEGVTVVTRNLSDFVVPVTVGILIVLFMVQHRGTATVAKWFGPIMALWFLMIAVLGAGHIGDDLRVLWALNPVYAARFIVSHGLLALVVLGSVFLAVTGAEALYADMGHFGRGPIRAAWLAFVLPALALNYLGQGALVLANPDAAANPFFLLAPDWARLPVVLFAMLATVIASQSVITGTFSLTHQAIQLGLLPRFEIRHTSEDLQGQIYLPRLNMLMLLGVVLLVLMFKTSSGLANTYGVAVTGSMMVDTVLAYFVLRKVWHWSALTAGSIALAFGSVEALFFIANCLKIFEGALIPLALAFGLFLIMATWVKGTRIVLEKARRETVPMKEFIGMIGSSSARRIEGTAVFLTSDPEATPAALLHNLKHNHVIHNKNVILTVRIARTPSITDEDRFEMTRLNDIFTLVQLNFGYMETPHVPRALNICRKCGLKFDIMSTSFFLNRRSFKTASNSPLPIWQEKLFIALTRDAANATDFYRLPAGRVVELGQQITV